jgi:hypothetical protein
MNGIDKIQSQYIYKVNPVNLFENRNQNGTNKFDGRLFAQQSNNIFNLNHPQMTGNGAQTGALDLLA